jgi:hypothetical protein
MKLNLKKICGITAMSACAFSLAFASAYILLGQDHSAPLTLAASAEVVPASEDVDNEYIQITSTNVTAANPLVIGGTYLLGTSSGVMAKNSFYENDDGSVLTTYLYSVQATKSSATVVTPTTDTASFILGGTSSAYTFQITNYADAESGSSYYLTAGSKASLLYSTYDSYSSRNGHYTYTITLTGSNAIIAPIGASSGYVARYSQNSDYFQLSNTSKKMTYPSLWEKYGTPMSLSVSGMGSATFGGSVSGVSVHAIYRDGRYRDVTSACTFTPVSNTLGSQTYNVNYTHNGQSLTSTCTVDVTNVNATPYNTASTQYSGSIIPLRNASFYDEEIAGGVSAYTVNLEAGVSLSSASHSHIYGPNYDSSASIKMYCLGEESSGTAGTIVYHFSTPIVITSMSLEAKSLYTQDYQSASITVTDSNGVSGGAYYIYTDTATSYPLYSWGTWTKAITSLTVSNPGRAVDFGGITFTYQMLVYTSEKQQAATINYIAAQNTCTTDYALTLRAALEYNSIGGNTVGQSADKTALEVKSFTYNGVAYSAYDKIYEMVYRYNLVHTSNPIYLYKTVYYPFTTKDGIDPILPVHTDNAGHIVHPSTSESATSMTLIIVAASGVITLLAIAGIYFASKKKSKQH